MQLLAIEYSDVSKDFYASIWIGRDSFKWIQLHNGVQGVIVINSKDNWLQKAVISTSEIQIAQTIIIFIINVTVEETIFLKQYDVFT